MTQAQPPPIPDAEIGRRLAEIYESWSAVGPGEGDGEARSPKSMAEVRRSRRALRALQPESEELRELHEQLSAAVETAARRERALGLPFFLVGLLSAGGAALLGLVLFANDPFARPAYEWDPADWVVEKPSELRWAYSESPAEAADPAGRALAVPKGTAVEPLATAASRVQVRLPSGEIGWLPEEVFSGVRRTAIRDEGVELFASPKLEGKPSARLAQGTRATVLRFEEHQRGVTRTPVARLRLEDGREGWVPKWQCRQLFLGPIPDLNQTYYYQVNAARLASWAPGRTLEELAARFGPPTSHVRRKDGARALFAGVVESGEGVQRKGVFFEFDAQGRVSSLRAVGTPRTRLYEKLPLLAMVRDADPYRLFPTPYYSQSRPGPAWWTAFKARNFGTRLLGWLWSLLTGALGIALVASFPRIALGPVLTAVAALRALSNSMVLLVNGALLLFAYYLFFLLVALVMDSTFNPLVVTLPMLAFWLWRLRRTLDYHRCPHCGSTYTALDAGARFVDRVQGSSFTTWRRDRGVRENSAGERVHTIELRDREIRTTTDRFLDQRTCARCGKGWDVARDVTVDTQVIDH